MRTCILYSERDEYLQRLQSGNWILDNNSSLAYRRSERVGEETMAHRYHRPLMDNHFWQVNAGCAATGTGTP